MKKFRYRDFQGNLWEQKDLKIDSALPYIGKRINNCAPKETVDADRLKKIIASIAVDCQRSITPDEANTMVESIKNFIIGEIDKAEKFYVNKERLKK